MVKRHIYQSKVSMTDGPDLAKAMLAGCNMAANRTCTHKMHARYRFESALSVFFGGLIRDIGLSKTVSRAKGKNTKEVLWSPRWHRGIYASFIDGINEVTG